MASRGRRGGVPAREDEPRREERAEQQAPTPQGPILPPLLPMDYGVFMQGEMEQYLEEKKASQKRPAATFQRQDKKKVVYETQHRSVAVDSTQRPQDHGLSETSAGSPARSASPSSSSSSSASYRKTKKASSPSSSPWLPVDDVEVCQLATTSRGVRSGQSSRPRLHRVLCFPHHRQWTMEYSCKERADVWCSSLLRTRFEDGAVDVAWDAFMRLFRAKFVPEHIQDKMEQEFLSLTQGSMTVLEYEARFSELSKYALHIVEDEHRKTKKFVMGLKPSVRTRLVAFDHRTLDEALIAAYRQEGEMEQYLEEKKASQKRPAATFQSQDKKKTVYQTPQKTMTASNSQVPSVRSPGEKKECPHCGKTHGGSECWLVAGRCLKCGSSDHKIKDCPRLQQGAQRGAPATVVAAAAPATGRPGRPRAPARVFALAREDAKQAEHVTEGTVLLFG
ncbi:hypothetical protein Taro_049937, partial [Colocasia esculenta]|nr:hypothetical protein [Colocasia esculenta]